MRAFTLPTNENGQPLPRSFWTVEQLRDHLDNLEYLQGQIVASQVDQLTQLSTLNRMAASLSERRSYDEVLADTLREVYLITDCREAWIIDASPDGTPGSVHCLDDPVIGPSCLPEPVTRIADSAFAKSDDKVRHVTQTTADEKHVYIGFPILTSKHLLGCLVFDAPNESLLADERRMKLLQSMLRQAGVACENDRLVEAVGEMMIEVVYGFALAVESRDPYTGGHVQRVTAYSLLLGKHLGLNRADLATLQMGGLMHDIGKIGVPDAVLQKPGRLNDEEFDLIKRHPVIGRDIIHMIPQLQPIVGLVHYHHERWDGKGYPEGLSGENIPLLARVIAVADTYDAMTSDRPYRPALSHAETMAEIERCAGTQLDPKIAKAFIRISEQSFKQAARRMQEWVQSKDHPGTIDVSGLLNLQMRQLQEPRKRAGMQALNAQEQQTLRSDDTMSPDHTILGMSALQENTLPPDQALPPRRKAS